jgi:purine-cytosine permease-like protein
MSIAGNYSAAFCVQLLGERPVYTVKLRHINFGCAASETQKVPRIVWNTVATIIYIVCAIGMVSSVVLETFSNHLSAGRNKLLPIFLNFLPLIGYW